MMDKEKVVNSLNKLIETCKDGEEGFKTAAEGVEKIHMVDMFKELSNQRAQFSRELQGLVKQFGGDPEDSGSFTGQLHRGWMNIKTLVTEDDETAILNECERGEDSAVAAYEDCLKEGFPSSVSDAVSRQYHIVKASHDRVKALRDRYRAVPV